LQIIKERWEKDIPKPLRKIPILVGGGGEKVTLKITAKYADMWHGFGDPEQIAHKMEVLNNWCSEVGRNPGEIECCCGTGGADSDKTREAYVQAGASHLILGMSERPGEPFNFNLVKHLVRWRDQHNG
ncbi:MAG TPA: LLM class flavin-dependent oxidoreductase, partial [Ktedonobacteraceae bacterium]|nr:LLM class flavin-dependent oxidoreductase [Ktedonobacteraceae bacterium]